jgi:N-acetylmuramoyl-L-alanine amidase
MRWVPLVLCGACAGEPVSLEEAPPPTAALAAAPVGEAAARVWPRTVTVLRELTLPVARRPRRWRVLIDAGHGSPGNFGNTGVHCQQEAQVMNELAFGLATRLSLMGPFEVKLSREDDRQPSYAARKAQAEAWAADAVVSLHSDSRGAAEPNVEPGCASLRNDDSPGFSVLWSAEGEPALITRRQRLSHALTAAMTEAGFLPYLGADYAGYYDVEPQRPGSFVNRKEHARRIWFLRRLSVPTVIIETHHALDVDEVARWGEVRTRHVFAAAVAKGLVDYFTAP